MEAILNLSNTEKTLIILLIAVLAFLILRKFYKKTPESGYIACLKPQVWDGVRCYNPGPKPKPTVAK